jgi:hypothetical protein
MLAAGASGGSSGSSNPAIEQLEELIARLKAQLAGVQSQIAAAERMRTPNGSPNPAVASLQGEAASIQGAIGVATAQLAELLMQQGQTAGGLINTQA